MQQPSDTSLDVTRYTYLVILALIFLHGTWNIVWYLILEQKWRAFPLSLMYICSQLTLIFAMARLLYPDQPEYANDTEGSYRPYLYL